MIITEKKIQIDSPEKIKDIILSILQTEHETDKMKEHCWIIGLNTKKVIQYIELVSLGILDASLVHPREVFRLAVMKAVDCIVMVHNHPSTDVYPSGADREVTKNLKNAGKILNIDLIDSIIVGGNTYYSFRENGII